MDREKKRRLEAKGWSVGSAEDFLGLKEEESAYIEMKLALSEDLKKKRVERRLTQLELANLVNSSQSRVAKMESGDPSVSLDSLVISLLSLGVTPKELSGMIYSRESSVTEV